ncbi:SGNH/GDSL hydrolase family protein [Spirillospora sp. NPDC029432]|uniref:SGNH/GDSL hydrolase family protein n=1 Tax=Spirillospora sp. NPDC029432 TaxID=3154599 RepID=UPI0034560D8F
MLTSGSVVVSGAAAAAATNYVALGDSYSSGTGAGSYDPGAGACNRSANAYPKKWAAANSPDSFKFVACSGATTSTVTSGQLGALSSSTTFVSITVGGNDAGFAKVMETCVLRSTASCETAVKNAEGYMEDTLPGKLDSLYGKIRSRASSARVVVLGYPRLYLKNSAGCVGLNQTKRTVLNRAADTLNTSIEKSVARAGFVFSDVRDDFSGHELCSGDGWLNSVTFPIGDSYHPTARGHANGYLPALKSAARRSLALHEES